MDEFPPPCCSGIASLRIPGRVVGVEVTQDEGVILGLEESGERGRIVRWAGRVWGNIDIVDVYWDVVDGDGNGEVFSGRVVGEKVSREVRVGDGVVDKGNETTPA